MSSFGGLLIVAAAAFPAPLALWGLKAGGFVDSPLLLAITRSPPPSG